MQHRNNFTVMVVDDFESDLPRIVGEFRDHGYKVVRAVNGQQALEMFMSKATNIVVTNIHMPKMNGVQLTRAIKILNSNTPVILFTGFGPARMFKQEKIAMADRFFEKPMDMGELLRCVDGLLGFPVDAESAD